MTSFTQEKTNQGNAFSIFLSKHTRGIVPSLSHLLFRDFTVLYLKNENDLCRLWGYRLAKYALIDLSFCSFICLHLPNSEDGQSHFLRPHIAAQMTSRLEASGGNGTLGHGAAGMAWLSARARRAQWSHSSCPLRGAEIPLRAAPRHCVVQSNVSICRGCLCGIRPPSVH